MSSARVLIADGDRRLRTQLYTRLLDVDVFSDAVATANDALEYLRDRAYGLILLDLDLPNAEAYAVIDQLRLMTRPERPMVLATASREHQPTVDPDLVQIIMRKPLRLADVADMIRSCVGPTRINNVPGGRQRSNGPIDLIGGHEQGIRVVS